MYHKLMVPLDGSELAECVLAHVEAFISQWHIPTIVFVRVLEAVTPSLGGEYAVNPEECENREAIRKTAAELYLKQVISRLTPGRTKFETKVLTGKPVKKLVDYAQNTDIDLILMATHGRSGVGRLVFGSVADRMLRDSSKPILLVRAPGAGKGGEFDQGKAQNGVEHVSNAVF